MSGSAHWADFLVGQTREWALKDLGIDNYPKRAGPFLALAASYTLSRCRMKAERGCPGPAGLVPLEHLLKEAPPTAVAPQLSPGLGCLRPLVLS